MPDFSQALPAVDQNLAGVWSELDKDYYTKYPYYLEMASTARRKKYSVFPQLITKTRRWTPQMGDTMKLVIPETSPLTRQEARPVGLASAPLSDIAAVKERTVTASLAWQRFFSPNARFLNSFQDFISEQLAPTRKAVEEQRDWFEECFYRTHMWDYSPRIFVAGYGLVNLPVGRNGTTSLKTPGVLQQLVQLCPGDGHLTFQHLFDIVSEAESVIGMTPYSGSNLPGGESSGLDDQFCLVQSHESFRQFVNDPWVKENRMLEKDIVNKPYKGLIQGQLSSRLERYPIRWQVDDNGTVTLPSPEVSVADNNQGELNRTAPNPAYGKIGSIGSLEGSPFEIAWLIGGEHYARIETGPPPEFFAGGTGDPAKIAGMQWNGQIYGTKDFLIYEKDADGNITPQTNSFGHWMRWQGELALGCIGANAHNVLPILYRRRRGLTNVLPS